MKTTKKSTVRCEVCGQACFPMVDEFTCIPCSMEQLSMDAAEIANMLSSVARFCDDMCHDYSEAGHRQSRLMAVSRLEQAEKMLATLQTLTRSLRDDITK